MPIHVFLSKKFEKLLQKYRELAEYSSTRKVKTVDMDFFYHFKINSALGSKEYIKLAKNKQDRLSRVP